MTKHFDMLPSLLQIEVRALHDRRLSLTPIERRRYLWLAKKALYLYALKASL
jgi:hypothetical protein